MTRSHRPARATARVPMSGGPGAGGTAGGPSSHGRHSAEPSGSYGTSPRADYGMSASSGGGGRHHSASGRASAYGTGGDYGRESRRHDRGDRDATGAWRDSGYSRRGSGDDLDGFLSDISDDRAVGRASVRPGGPGGPPRDRTRSAGRQAQRNRSRDAKRRRRTRRIIAASAATLMLLGVAVIAGTVMFVEVNPPAEQPLPQASVIVANDNTTTIAREGDTNRTLVNDPSKVPEHVKMAVVAAEDRSFYKNSGIDLKGIARAAWNNLTDDDTEGASTITQQYVRNVFNLNRDKSYTRKTKEAIYALKLAQRYTKEEILMFYLDTIYFGRNAYGIQAAAEAYFGVKDVSKLTIEQGALIATVIKNPSGYDPAVNPEEAKGRWKWVLNSMVEMGYKKAEGVATDERFPTVLPRKKSSGGDPAASQIMKYVYEELAPLGITQQDLSTGGYRIRTSIDPMLQRIAVQAVTEKLKGQPTNLTSALVAVDPATGRVLAYYGGAESLNGGWDQAGYNGSKRSGGHPPGSSFKPYVLATALKGTDKKDAASIESVWDGSTGRTFEGREAPLHNPGKADCPRCNLIDATVKSLNTTYYAMTEAYGKEEVIRTASKSGVRFLRTDQGKLIDISTEKGIEEAARTLGNEVGIGQYRTSVLEQASGIATFANEGVHVKTHFVLDVLQGGRNIYSESVHKPKKTVAFPKSVAHDATFVMQQVIKSGKNDLKGGRQSAGKTGTWQWGSTSKNAHAWTVGYTRQLAAAVWVGDKKDANPIKDKNGRDVYGSGLPGQIWKKFMDDAHETKLKQAKTKKDKDFWKKKKFADPPRNGDPDAGDAEPLPEPDPSPSVDPEQPEEPTDPHETGDPEPSDPRPSDDRDRPFPRPSTRRD